jgi:hypothetical protein
MAPSRLESIRGLVEVEDAYLAPTFTRCQIPVISPTAHKRSATRSRESTRTPCPLTSTPTVSRPRFSMRDRRPVATQQLIAA